MPNPFTLTYNALYNAALQNEILQRYIRAKNFVRLDNKKLKQTGVNTADLPELLLTQQSVSGQIIATSSSTALQVQYVFAAAIGSWDLAELTSEIQWGLITTSASWCAELGALKWNDLHFINNVELGEVAITLTDTTVNRGISGWSLFWPLKVSMRLSTNELREYQVKE